MPKYPLQITTRTSRTPDFKFELLPLHSPLLRQSLLVSFPPLIDMLKFSGYPYLIRGQLGSLRRARVAPHGAAFYCAPLTRHVELRLRDAPPGGTIPMTKQA